MTITTLPELLVAVQRLYGNGSITRQLDIAERTGYNETVISNYLSGRIKPSRNFLDKFNSAFKADLQKTAAGAKGIPYLDNVDALMNGKPGSHATDYVHVPGFGDADYFVKVMSDIVALRKVDKREVEAGHEYLFLGKSRWMGEVDKRKLRGVKSVYLVLGRITREVV